MLFTVENWYCRPDHVVKPFLIIKRKTSLSHFEQCPFKHRREWRSTRNFHQTIMELAKYVALDYIFCFIQAVVMIISSNVSHHYWPKLRSWLVNKQKPNQQINHSTKQQHRYTSTRSGRW
tara:strand:- start:87 stop:446 length:360 start_codon:yes stop_codon:yes gene_type:complete